MFKKIGTLAIVYLLTTAETMQAASCFACCTKTSEQKQLKKRIEISKAVLNQDLKKLTRLLTNKKVVVNLNHLDIKRDIFSPSDKPRVGHMRPNPISPLEATVGQKSPDKLAITQLLLDHNAVPEAGVIEFVVHQQDTHVLQLFLNPLVVDLALALPHACRTNNPLIVDMLIQAGGDRKIAAQTYRTMIGEHIAQIGDLQRKERAMENPGHVDENKENEVLPEVRW